MHNPIEPPESLSPLERYQVFRSRIEHEDNLIMQRLSWLMASQSFLFTAYAIVTNGLANPPPTGPNPHVIHLRTLIRIIPIVALLNSLLIAISITAAIVAINHLRRSYQNQPGTLQVVPLQTTLGTRVMGLSAPVLLPLLFLSVWLFLLMQ